MQTSSVPSDPVEIVELADCQHVVPLLGRWHAAEFGHLYPGWDEAAACAELAAMTVAGVVPTTWVAFRGSDRRQAAVIGSISLIADDELDGWRDAGPWLASLFVHPAARRAGVGGLLIDHCVTEADRFGVGRLHLFTEDREEFYRRRGWRTVEHRSFNERRVAVMVLEPSPRVARRSATSRWCSDPYVGGAYSYLRVGGSPADRAALGERIGDGLVLAGEATSVDHPGTAHGAWFSGQRAAELVAAERSLPGRAVVVGAGLAGIAAAHRLTDHGWEVVVLEAGPTIGGRTRVDRSLGGAVPLGATWAHGTVDNPWFDLARRAGAEPVRTRFEHRQTVVPGLGWLEPGLLTRLEARQSEIEERLATIAETGPDTAVGPALRAELAALADPLDRQVLGCWLRSEFENLYAAPVDDLSRRFLAEPFRLAGHDVMLAGDLGAAVALAAAGLAIRCDAPVGRIRRAAADWEVEAPGGSERADAVVVTVAVPVLQAGRIEFDPPLPRPVVESLRRIGAGPVAKVFATFDRRWWPADRAFWVAADPPGAFEVFVDATRFVGRPALSAFAVGDVARRVERMSDDDRCDLMTAVLAGVPAG